MSQDRESSDDGITEETYGLVTPKKTEDRQAPTPQSAAKEKAREDVKVMSQEGGTQDPKEWKGTKVINSKWVSHVGRILSVDKVAWDLKKEYGSHGSSMTSTSRV